jgi:hypothetical protein
MVYTTADVHGGQPGPWPPQGLFGTRVLVEIGRDNPHQTPNPHSFLKVYLVLEYWASIIPANPHSFLNFSVFFSMPNTLPLPSGLWVEFCGDWVKVGVSSNTLGDYPHQSPPKL